MLYFINGFYGKPSVRDISFDMLYFPLENLQGKRVYGWHIIRYKKNTRINGKKTFYRNGRANKLWTLL